MGQSQIAEHNRRKGETEQKAGDLSCPCFAYVLAQFWDLSWVRSCRYGLLVCLFRYFGFLSVFSPDSFSCKVLTSSRRGKYWIVFSYICIVFFSCVSQMCPLLCSNCGKFGSLSSKFATCRAARVHSDSAEIRPSEPDQGYLEAIADVSMNRGVLSGVANDSSFLNHYCSWIENRLRVTCFIWV